MFLLSLFLIRSSAKSKQIYLSNDTINQHNDSDLFQISA